MGAYTYYDAAGVLGRTVGLPELLLTLFAGGSQQETAVEGAKRARVRLSQDFVFFRSLGGCVRLPEKTVDHLKGMFAGDGRRRVLRDFTAHPYDIPGGSVAAYYPETNPLLPLAHHDPKSKTPAAKSIPVFVTAQDVHP